MNVFKFRFNGLKDQITSVCVGGGEDVDEVELGDEVETDVICEEVHLIK